jgi:hypothetical protein
MPAGLLVLLVLASVAVDMSMVHLRHRQALDVAASAANDAVTAAADPAQLRRGVYRIEPSEAREVARRTIAASGLAAHMVGPARVVVDGANVQVSITVRAEHFFTGALPGTPDSTVVTATASATAVQSE